MSPIEMNFEAVLASAFIGAFVGGLIAYYAGRRDERRHQQANRARVRLDGVEQ